MINDSNNDNYILQYYSNVYDNYGYLKLKTKLISDKSVKESSLPFFLYDLNKIEYQLLINLINKQEKVIEIYNKKNKRLLADTIKSSLELLFEYKKKFDDWFSSNKP